MIDRLRNATRTAGRENRIARRVLLGLALLALAGNVGFLFATRSADSETLVGGSAGQSADLIFATRIDDNRVLTATRGNDLMVNTDGVPGQSVRLEKSIGGIAVNADGSEYYVGTSDGLVSVFDATLAPLRQIDVGSRVVGLAINAAGTLVVGHGSGSSGDRYFVSAYTGADGDALFSVKAGFIITAVAAFDDVAIFGTNNSRVASVSLATGEIGWTDTLANPISRLLVLPSRNQILAGDSEGGLILLDGQGTELWQTTIGPYPVRGLAFDEATKTFFAGDANGNLVSVSEGGAVTLTRSVSGADVEAILPSGEQYVVVPRDGSWTVLSPDAVDSARKADRLNRLWLFSDLLLIVLAAVAAVVAVEPSRLWAKRTLRQAKRGWLGYAFILPAIVLIGVFSYYPVGLAFYYSMTNFSLRHVTEWVGFDNYRQILTDDVYFRAGFKNMAILAGLGILKTLTIPLLVAELVFWLKRGSHQYLFRTLFVLPAIVPGLVFTLMWKQVYDPNTGLLNNLLAAVGLDSWQRAWLGDEKTALWAIAGVGFPFIDAFGFLILLGGLLAINADLFDAAKIDGARWKNRFLDIELPMLLPQFRVLLFFAVIGSVQGFATIVLLTRGGPGYSTYVPSLQMYLRIADGEFGYASAIGVILFVIVLLLTFFVLRFRRNDAIEAT